MTPTKSLRNDNSPIKHLPTHSLNNNNKKKRHTLEAPQRCILGCTGVWQQPPADATVKNTPRIRNRRSDEEPDFLRSVWKIILVQHSADVQLCVNYGLASFLHRGFFFIFFAFFFLVSMAPQRSSQWNLLPPLWSCNTRSVMSQSSKYIAVIRMHPLMGFEMVFNWTPPRWCVRRSRKEKKKQKTLNRIQIAFKARGQIFAPENKSPIFAPHKSSRAAPGRFFPSDQLWILTLFFSCLLILAFIVSRAVQFHSWCIIEQFYLWNSCTVSDFANPICRQ